MADHGIVRLDKIASSYNGNFISAQSSSDIDNGNVIVTDGLLSGSTEIFVAATPTSITTETVLLVASPEIQGALYTPDKMLKDFYNEANRPLRAYYLTKGDIFTVTSDAYSGTAAEGSYLIPQSGSYQLIVSATTSSAVFAAKIIDVISMGYTGSGWAKKTAAVCEVVSS